MRLPHFIISVLFIRDFHVFNSRISRYLFADFAFSFREFRVFCSRISRYLIAVIIESRLRQRFEKRMIMNRACEPVPLRIMEKNPDLGQSHVLATLRGAGSPFKYLSTMVSRD